MRLRILLSLFVFLSFQINSQVRFCSWNIQNFGKSKTDSNIIFIANTISNFDVVAIVEVVAGHGGAQAVARLAEELNRRGSKWDYSISDPTVGTPSKSERYAFLWKTSRVQKVGEAWLEKQYSVQIEREPYFASFTDQGKEFTVSAFHAITKKNQPETEIKYFKFLPAQYPGKNILFSGDFNCSESHTVFNPLKIAHYNPALSCQKTSLKNECIGSNCLASEYDNIFYNSTKIKLLNSGVLEFYKAFPTLQAARRISDHLPVFIEFEVLGSTEKNLSK